MSLYEDCCSLPFYSFTVSLSNSLLLLSSFFFLTYFIRKSKGICNLVVAVNRLCRLWQRNLLFVADDWMCRFFFGFFVEVLFFIGTKGGFPSRWSMLVQLFLQFFLVMEGIWNAICIAHRSWYEMAWFIHSAFFDFGYLAQKLRNLDNGHHRKSFS